MDTSALKSFAPKARIALIADVAVRVAAVLAPGSTERVESPSAVARLERAIEDAGGGTTGQAAVAERVAYTWFNRIVALRFMDANGYTGVGVISPPAGQAAGQPEILSRARAGVIDAEVVSQTTAARVTALLDGTRRSTDPQGEAYAALLEAYCRRWAETLRDIFGTGGDEIELLVPPGLLADTSVRAQAVHVLTEEACEDVEVIGWLYQFYISERKDEVFAGFKKYQKAGPAEIPAATQLFTPDWIVRYLVQNSLGRLWMLNHPESGLRVQMEYYLDPIDEVTDFLKISTPEEIKVVDPACGSGHMLTYAFDLLYAIYEEEGYALSEIPTLILTYNLFGIEIDPRAEALASFALTMKARDKDRRFFVRGTKPNICVLTPIRFTPDELDLLRPATIGQAKRSPESETVDLLMPSCQEIDAFWNQFEHADTFGSLIQPDAVLIEPLRHHVEAFGDNTLGVAELRAAARRVLDQAEYLTQRYHVTVANPPYMKGENMGARLSAFAKAGYSNTRANLFAMFIERCMQAVLPGGAVAMITMQSWMYTKTYARLRAAILNDYALETMAHLGAGAFESIGGEVVSTTAFTVWKRKPESSAVIIGLDDLPDGEAKHRSFLDSVRTGWVAAGSDGEGVRRMFRVAPKDFEVVPGAPIVYGLEPRIRQLFAAGPPLSDRADLKEGLSSSDADRFVRSWWEVSRGRVLFRADSGIVAAENGARWFPFNKGGEFRRWYGNQEHLVNWQLDGEEIRAERPKSTVRNPQYYFKPTISWSKIGTSSPAFRRYPEGFVLASAAKAIYLESAEEEISVLSIANSSLARVLLEAKSPTLSFVADDIGAIPMVPLRDVAAVGRLLDSICDAAKMDWDDFETSWDFHGPSVLTDTQVQGRVTTAPLASIVVEWSQRWKEYAQRQKAWEEANNAAVVEAFGIDSVVPTEVALHRVSLTRNVAFRYGPGRTPTEYSVLERADFGSELVSYAVGCMFGRYSLDLPGLVLADQGSTLAQYRAKLAEAGLTVGQFQPDEDGVLPIVDDEWFADDIVTRFHEFLRVAFGEEHLAENVRFVEESLGVKTLREYFITKTGKSKFYDDHVKRYKKRPIYWMFSSPKGSFNALVYLHRYTPSTAGTVLNEYLREYQAKLATAIAHEERVAASSSSPRDAARAAKEAERLRKVVMELDAYEHEALYPLAARQVALDLDDGVKANYPKLGAALRKFAGLEASNG